MASTDAGHSGPHILAPKGDIIAGWDIFGIHITTTIFSTWIFMGILFVLVGFLYTAIRTDRFPRIRALGLDAMKRIDAFMSDSLSAPKSEIRIFFVLFAGLFAVIFLGNIFGLMVDWLSLSIPVLHYYLRPFHSDLSTTLVLALVTIIIVHATSIIRKGFFTHIGHYLFHFSGSSLIERIINVPVGWIHLLSEFGRVISLSVRLFANIFAGAILIGVISYLSSQLPLGGFGFLGGILVLPIWFFEILVAFLQAFIFITLTGIYIKEAITTHETH